jgi:hypothetical protein
MPPLKLFVMLFTSQRRCVAGNPAQHGSAQALMTCKPHKHTSLPCQGVWERDTWRGHDSFQTFREVFQQAKACKADLVLLGGDLFHDNKPSRNTLVKCLDILNEHCLSDAPISFQARLPPRSRALRLHFSHT